MFIAARAVVLSLALPIGAGLSAQARAQNTKPQRQKEQDVLQGVAGDDATLAARLQASMEHWREWEEAIRKAFQEQDASRGKPGEQDLLNMYVNRAEARDQAIDLYLAGRFFGIRGDLESAKRYFERAALKDQYFYPACHGLGTYYANKSDLAEAEKWYRKGLEINPHFNRARFALAALLFSKDKPADAEIELRTLKIDEPNNVDADLMLGQIHLKRGESQKATEYLEGAAKKHPDRVDVQEFLAQAYASDLQKVDQAIAIYRTLRAKDPSSCALAFHEGQLLVRVGHNKEAAECLEQALQTLPEKSSINKENLKQQIQDLRSKAAVETVDPNRKTRKEYCDILLNSTEVERRRDAIRVLASPESLASLTAEVQTALLKALKDKDPEVKIRAIGALADIGDPDYVKLFKLFLDDADLMVRARAAAALKKLDNVEAVPYLVKRIAIERDPSAFQQLNLALLALTPGSFGWTIIGNPTPEQMEELRKQWPDWYEAHRAKYRAFEPTEDVRRPKAPTQPK